MASKTTVNFDDETEAALAELVDFWSTVPITNGSDLAHWARSRRSTSHHVVRLGTPSLGGSCFWVEDLRGTRLVGQLLCDLGLMVVIPLGGELRGGEVTVRGMRSVHVVVDPVVFDDNSGFEQAVEPPHVEEFVA